MLKIVSLNVESLIPAKFQPKSRTEEKRLKYLKHSMEEHGYIEAFPIIVNEDMTIADGHRRVIVAKMLSIDKVPAVVIDGTLSIDDLWGLSTITESPSSTEILEAYTEGMKTLPARYANSIMLLQSVMGGKRALATLFRKGRFSPAVYHVGKHVANYCNQGDDTEFLVKTIVWIVEKKMGRNVRMAMEANIDSQTLISAIEENRFLSIVANVV